jgi:hypothetical protein
MGRVLAFGDSHLLHKHMWDTKLLLHTKKIGARLPADAVGEVSIGMWKHSVRSCDDANKRLCGCVWGGGCAGSNVFVAAIGFFFSFPLRPKARFGAEGCGMCCVHGHATMASDSAWHATSENMSRCSWCSSMVHGWLECVRHRTRRRCVPSPSAACAKKQARKRK